MIWDKIVPAHSVFHKDTETFTKIWSDWYTDFDEFYSHCAADIENGKKAKGFSIPDVPDNTFDITYIPSLHFSSVDLKLSESGKYLAPIVTVGESVKKENRMMMPLSMEISHAVADTFHIARFFSETEAELAEIAVRLSGSVQ
jgi:chloramphenicol O-acetyltransferase type A